MGLRLLDYPQQPSNVIPLRAKEDAGEDSGVPVVAETPEPVQLYYLTVLAFVLHTPTVWGCASCGQNWPCRQLRLAFRLREGF